MTRLPTEDEQWQEMFGDADYTSDGFWHKGFFYKTNGDDREEVLSDRCDTRQWSSDRGAALISEQVRGERRLEAVRATWLERNRKDS